MHPVMIMMFAAFLRFALAERHLGKVATRLRGASPANLVEAKRFRSVEADLFCARNLTDARRSVALSTCVGSYGLRPLDHLMARSRTSEPKPPGMPVFFVTAPTGDWRPW